MNNRFRHLGPSSSERGDKGRDKRHNSVLFEQFSEYIRVSVIQRTPAAGIARTSVKTGIGATYTPGVAAMLIDRFARMRLWQPHGGVRQTLIPC